MIELIPVLTECLRHFAHMDEANAAIHCANVRYSPITFRVAETLFALDPEQENALLRTVLGHKGMYEEDPGR